MAHSVDRGSGPGPADEPTTRRTGLLFRPVNLLLLVPLIGTLVPEFYNYDTPRIGGMPFFYWYQLLWIAVSVILTVIVYRATRSDR